MREGTIQKSLLTATVIAGCAGIIYFLQSRDIDHVLDEQPLPEIFYPCYFVAVVTALLSSAMPKAPWKIAIAAIVGIAGGVGINAFVDDLIFDTGHNLFPLEMMLWSFISTPGALVGTAVGSLVYFLRIRMHNKRMEHTR